MQKITLFILISLLVIACSKPLPQERIAYSGQWQSDNMYLHIMTDGKVSYKRIENGTTTSIDAPIQEFKNDSFVVGLGPMNTTFEVTKPPTQVDGVWHMTVDGEELIKVSD